MTHKKQLVNASCFYMVIVDEKTLVFKVIMSPKVAVRTQ